MDTGNVNIKFEKNQQLYLSRRMNSWVTGILLFGISLFITLFCFYIQQGPIIETLKSYIQQPLLIPLNWFPVFILTLILYFALKNVFFAGAISGGIFAILSYVNLLKIEGREDTLVPSDILLIREALNATQEYELNMHWGMVSFIAAMVVMAILAGIFIKSAVPKLKTRICGIIAGILVFCLALNTVYSNKNLYNNFKVLTHYNVPLVFNTFGFNYCFLYNLTLNSIEKPENYSQKEVEQWIAESGTEKNESEIKPNIIFVMCEAFSDLSAEDVFTYSEEDNPLYDFYKVANSDRAISGHIVVTNYGAGTSNTEFNIMTGMQTNMIGEGVTSSFRAVRKKTDSLASVLKEDGYNSFFMHPGQSWFYNRVNVYKYLGITDQVFEDAFDLSDYKGPMVSDAAFLDELKSDLQSRMIESDAPLFTYTVTIQNHQAYTYKKYPKKPEPAQVSIPVSDSAMEQLSVYMEGVRDSSSMLLGLTDFLDTVDEPTILVFFGDHRPNLGSACEELELKYNKDHSPEGIVETFSTPYVIWVNQAYADAVDLNEAYGKLELPKNGYISDNYLGAVVLQLSGHSGYNAFFDYLNELRLELPILRDKVSVYGLMDGSLTTTITPEQSKLVDKFVKWSYYLLK